MQILVVDPDGTVAKVAEPVFQGHKWHSVVVDDRARALSTTLQVVPDVVVVHGDGPTGEAAHLCQRFKHNALTAGIPVILVEDAPPPAWLITGMPADAFTMAPWEPQELVHHIELLAPNPEGTAALDDLTNFPRRRSILAEIARRLATRELFAIGLLALREADAYRQSYGRTGLDSFVVLLSVLLRRHTTAGSPVSIGYLDEGTFVILGAPARVHELMALTMRDFEALVPAYYEMDTLFGEQDHEVGPATWISVHGSVCLAEPGRFDNLLQIGFVLAESLAAGEEIARQATERGAAEAVSPLAS